jgi:hypothetical protein
MALNFSESAFRYEPYPIGLSRNIFSQQSYPVYLQAWPPHSLFHGFRQSADTEQIYKYSLSERNNPTAYETFVSSMPLWAQFRSYVKSPRFRSDVFTFLRNAHIDLGLRGDEASLTTRFEFSMLSALGGFLRPHTDSPGKIVTLILSMHEGDWDQDIGGGTTVMRPKDTSRNFNYLNANFEFAQMETLYTFPFLPNQCITFIKTFNSWHAVKPLAGSDPELFRRTLTINIEKAGANVAENY